MSFKEVVILLVIAGVGYWAGMKGVLNSVIPSGS